MMNAVIYARYSSYGQTEQSIEGQLRRCNECAKQKGLTVVREYADRAISGRTDGRPAFQQMIEDAAKQDFQFVIVYAFDRFARNRYDSVLYKHELNKYGVRVISATEDIGTSDEGMLLEAMLEASADLFSRRLSKRVKVGMAESARKGKYVGGTPPFGYRVVNGKMVIDEKQAEIVRRVFRQYADGIGKKKIVDDLNANGYRTASGSEWKLSSISSMLPNRKYIGEYIYDGIDVSGGCPAIVDKALFDDVQKVIAATKHAPASKKAKIEYLLHGKAFCGYCGSPMIGESGRGNSGKIYNYYACSAKKKRHTCKKRNEKKGYIEWFVVEQTVRYVLVPERIERIADAIIASYENDLGETKIKKIETSIALANRELDKCAEDFTATKSSALRERLEKKADALALQIEEMQRDIEKLKIIQAAKLDKKDIIAWISQFCKGDELDAEFQRKIIRTFVNSVFLYDDKIVIYYNIKGGKQITHMQMLESTDEILTCEPVNKCSDLKAHGTPVASCRIRYRNSLWWVAIFLFFIMLHQQPVAAAEFTNCFCHLQIRITRKPTSLSAAFSRRIRNSDLAA